jgi:dCMP deaminase
MSDRWDRHFLARCVLNARMSKDPRTQVGAIIVGPHREQRADGFNGFPRGIADTFERLNDRDMKMKLIVHAERNAICNAARVGVSVLGCTLYLAATDDTGMIWGGPPCSACSIELIQAGITTIVSYPIKATPSRWHEDLEFARGVLGEAGVNYREITP